MSKMSAPQSAPPHRIRERNNLKNSAQSNSGFSRHHGDLTIDDLEVDATSAVAEANNEMLDNTNKTKTRCMTAPPKHVVTREVTSSRASHRVYGRDSRIHNRPPGRVGLSTGRKVGDDGMGR